MLAPVVQTSKTTFDRLHHRCKHFQKCFDHRMAPAESLCQRYSYIELTWGLMLSRNVKMKRETDLRLLEMPSRRAKPIKIFWKRQNEAGNGENSSKSHFPRRERGEMLRKTASCGGKASKSFGDRFRATGKGAYGIRPQNVSNGNDFAYPYK